MRPDLADACAEGWRIGRSAARHVVWSVEGEAKPGARDAVALALRRIEALPPPDRFVPLPRADRLEGAIRAALALHAEDLTREAIDILREALR